MDKTAPTQLETNLTSLYMDPSTKQHIRKMARADKLSVSEFLRNLVYQEHASREARRRSERLDMLTKAQRVRDAGAGHS